MKCPGQDSRFWGPEAIFEARCPACGSHIEFFKDESSRKCRKCGKKVLNPKMDFGCAAYCRHAEQCLGGDIPPELLARRTDLLKDRVAVEVKKSLGRDFRRIARTLRIIRYAEKIVREEEADPATATLAACLIALLPAGPGETGEALDDARARAEDILSRTGAPPDVARQVLAILEGMARGSRLDSTEYKCVFDAARAAAIEEAWEAESATAEEIAEWIEETLLTRSGRELAREITGRGHNP